MKKEQAREWDEAQKIKFSVDLVEAAKNHLKFLAVVDRNRYLYEDHVLQRAIYRYNAFWLPLLAKHMENPEEQALVVPLDCEWIWHCHRLNPLRYKSDCEKLFGRILGNQNVVSSVQATSKSTTEEIWNRMYPGEPYELDISTHFLEDASQKLTGNENFTSYDLISAVKRQMSFTFQITRPYTSDDLYLQEAVARYKGFLHMVRTTEKKKMKCFCVPTYDIDLIWHTHQLHPDSYSKDLTNAVGRVVHHNDTAPDRLLNTGFSEITRQWGETFGKSYSKAGTLGRGNSPTPVTQVPVTFSKNVQGNKLSALDSCGSPIQISTMKITEVLIEFGEIKNLPEGCKGNLTVYFSKKQPDKLFNTKRSLSISSETGEKQIAFFQCEATGEFLLELMSNTSTSNELLGSCSLSLEELMASKSQLSYEKWLSVEPMSGQISSEAVLLRASISFTPPTLAPQVFQLSRSKPISEAEKTCTRVLDQDGNTILSIDMRDTMEDTTKSYPDLLKEVNCITHTGEKQKLAEFVGSHWSIKGPNGSFKLQNSSGNDDSLFELVGYKMVKLFPGKRLDFETIQLENQTLKQGFLTAVEFSTDYPYGKAVALIDLNSKSIQTTEDWIILPGITLTFILSDILKEEIDYEIENVIHDISKTGDSASLGCMLKKGAQCVKCYFCGVVASEGFANCAKCYFCGVVAGGESARCGRCSMSGDIAGDQSDSNGVIAGDGYVQYISV